MKKLIRNFLLFFIIFLVIAAVFSSFTDQKGKSETVGLETLISRINNDEIGELVVSGDKITATLKDGKSESIRKEPNESLSALLSNFAVDPAKVAGVKISVKDESGWDYWLANIIPFLLPLLLVGIFIFFTMRGLQGANSRAMSFGQSTAKDFKPDAKNRATFKDVAGAKEAKEELQEIVEFLRFPKKFHDLGAKIPRGVLLLGAPGTGKTLLARSVAGEAQVPFFHMSGSEFVEMFVGVGASRVRSLFEKAKKNAPCIVFIDEIDAVGRRRGAGLGGSHDEREQTLNQILVEMDGFEPTQSIIVIAATNRPDVLDPALLRPGRFDRRVILDRPDLRDREAILAIHAEGKPLAPDVNLKRVAERTTGLSGADLMNIMNEGAIFAARRDRKQVAQQDLLDAIEKILLGPERKSHILSEGERMITAYHEAGHAVVGHMLPHCDEVHKVSIVSRGRAAGYTMSVPNEDKKMHSRAEFVDELAMMLGGYMAEQEIFGDLTTGASNDLQRATALARELVTQYGMSEVLGPRTYGQRDEMIFLGKQIHESRDYSESVAQVIDQEINALLAGAKETAREIIRGHREKMDKVVGELLAKETIEKDAFDSLLGPAVKAPKIAIKPIMT